MKYNKRLTFVFILCVCLIINTTSIYKNYSPNELRYWGSRALTWAREKYGDEYFLSHKTIEDGAQFMYEYGLSHPEDNPYNLGWDKQTVDSYFASYGKSKALLPYKGNISASSTTSAPSATTNTAASQPSVEKHIHSYAEKLTTAPTCTEKGLKTFTCSCGDSYTEEVEAIGHSYSEPAIVEATCTTDGSSTIVCDICGEEVVDIVKALGHDFYTTPTIIAASCISDGLMTYKCSRCDEVYEEVIPAYGHTTSDWIVDKPNGMFTKGSQHKECLDCKEVMESSEIPSTYPIWYLYFGIGLAIVIIGIITGIVIKKRNK